MKQDTLIVIPCRMESTRFPGKPLKQIYNRLMIDWVYDAAKETGFDVIIATDSSEIYNECRPRGMNVVLTGDHPNGTSRMIEAIGKLDKEYECYINLQCDEPLVDSNDLKELARAAIFMGGPVTLYKNSSNIKDFIDTNTVKVVGDSEAYYFSRQPIPYKSTVFKKHIGIYAFDEFTLNSINNTDFSKYNLYNGENLEQLKWIDAGFTIRLIETKNEYIGVDTPEDLQAVELFLENQRRSEHGIFN